MPVVTPPPVQRGALRPSQAKTQPHNLQSLNFCFTSFPISSFHHLQDFPTSLLNNISSGPSLSPTSLISGASIYFMDSKPERTWVEEGSRHQTFMLPLLFFFKRRTGQKRSDIGSWQTSPPRRGRRGRPVPQRDGPRAAPRPGSAPLAPCLSQRLRHRHRASPACDRGSPPSPQASRALTRSSPPPQSLSSQPLIPLPPSLRPLSTYPQKANFQLPQSHGRAGSAFSERLRRGPAGSSPSPRRPPPARPGYPHTALLLRLRGRAAILGGRRSPHPRPPLAVVPLGC